MLARTKRGRDAEPSNGNFMSDKQFSDYLADLRTNRAARLNGSRPLLHSRSGSLSKNENGQEAIHGHQRHGSRPLVTNPSQHTSANHHSATNMAGNTVRPKTSSSELYHEEDRPHLERAESRTLRMALGTFDLDEEQRVYDAAQDEASKLVLEHRSGSPTKKATVFANPDLSVSDQKVHLRKASYGRSFTPVLPDISDTNIAPSPLKEELSVLQQVGSVTPAELIAGPFPAAPPAKKKKSYQSLANAVATDIANMKRRVSSGTRRKASSDKRMFPTAEERIYEEEPEVTKEVVPVREVETPAPSQQGPTVDSQQAASQDASRHVRKNPFARFTKDRLERANSVASAPVPRFNPVEIQRNPPSQSRKPWYMANKPASAPAVPQVDPSKRPASEPVEGLEGGVEIRSEEIRNATSMKRKDRSTNLPQPTAVSDTPGRPIVSFQTDWSTRELQRQMQEKIPPASSRNAVVLEPAKSQLGRQLPEPSPVVGPSLRSDGSHSAPPTMVAPNGIPILNLPDNDEDAHSRVLSEEPEMPAVPLLGSLPQTKEPLFPRPANRERQIGQPKRQPADDMRSVTMTPTVEIPVRPLPVPVAKAAASRPHSMPLPERPRSGAHLTPIEKRNVALCAQCALPIAGRILTAAGERFHPECFACYQCGIGLECVAFYPEPDKKYYERIARIQQRRQGFEPELPHGCTEEDVRRLEEQDGDECMRFFCHLDFHEIFSPRCKSCKTPIEGEVVVACGAEWHVGHFFCAQCGDPFDSKTPFVEKDGYAWCLGCHTNRYSPKCRRCRKPITEIVVNALGHDWHGHCFCCTECGGGFEDGQFFLRGASDEPFCVRSTTIPPSLDRSSRQTPVREPEKEDRNDTSLSKAAPESDLSHASARATAKFFTPALYPDRPADLAPRPASTALFGRLRSGSNISEAYYTAAWNTPNDPSQIVGTGTSAQSQGRSRRSSESTQGSLSAGFVFGLDHLVPSRLPKNLLFDEEDEPHDQLSPTVARQLRAAPKSSAQGFGLFGDHDDFLTEAKGVPQSPPRPSRSETTMLASRWAPSPEEGEKSRQKTNSEDVTARAESAAQSAGSAPNLLSSRWASAPEEEVTRETTDQGDHTEHYSRSRKASRALDSSNWRSSKLANNAEAPVPSEPDHASLPNENAKAVASRPTSPAPAPSVERDTTALPEATDTASFLTPSSPTQPLELSSETKDATEAEMRQAPREVLPPRKKKKVPWNGRQCVILLPGGAPEDFGGHRPMTLKEAETRYENLSEAGYDVRGFDVDFTDGIADVSVESDHLFFATEQLYAVGDTARADVRIPDPKAWQAYVDWLVEEKLRALGVGGPDETPSISSRETSGQHQPRTFSPIYSVTGAGSQALSHPLSQRSTPALSNFSTGPHSRTMSIASPLSSGPENRGHAHRPSVYGMPQQFPPQMPGFSPSFRPYSPSQQLSLNAVARAVSPGLDRVKSSASPVPRSTSPFEAPPFRPSPLSARPDSVSSLDPEHRQLQGVIASPHGTQVNLTPVQSLPQVPEDDVDSVQHITPRANLPSSEIHVPTPRGHRHNISENLEKEIREAEETLDQTSSIEVPPSMEPTPASFGQFGPRLDSFSFKPTIPVQQQHHHFQFGAPPPGPGGFPHMPFSFQQQMPFSQPAFNPTQPPFRPQASEFTFNAARPPSAFDAGPILDMFPEAPVTKPAPPPAHSRKHSSANFDVTAPAFRPQTFTAGTSSLPSSKFDFASSYEFKPGARAFEPSKSTDKPTPQQSIFGEVNIPDVVKPARRSKAIAIVRPNSSDQDATAEDESGRITASADRQKRAFRSSERDGDSVPMFAQRPDSPVRRDLSDTEAAGVLHDGYDSVLPEDDLSGRVLDKDVNLAPDNADTEMKDPVEDGVLALSTDEEKENAPVQTNSTFSPFKTQGHARKGSSLSALAKPFEIDLPVTQPAQSLPVETSAIELEEPPRPNVKLDPAQPEFHPSRIFSREAAGPIENLQTAFEPDKSAASPRQNASPFQLAELTFDPSFEEIDAVMRQLNDDEDDDATAGRTTDVQVQLDEAEVVVPSIEADVARSSDPADIISQLSEASEPSLTSVQIHSIAGQQSVSPLSEGTPFELPATTVLGPRAHRNIGPSSEWSDDFSPGAAERIRQRSGFFDDRVDEVIGKAFEQHLKPLQNQLDALRLSLSEARPLTSDSRSRRRRVSSNLESDADDEDDVVDSKFMNGNQSRSRTRKVDTVKNAVLEALALHQSAEPLSNDHAHLRSGFDQVNDRLDTLFTKGFELRDIRGVVQDVLDRHAATIVHVPRPASTESEREEHFGTKKLLKLAEDELDSLRKLVADKERRLDKLYSERRDFQTSADEAREAELQQKRRADDLEEENAAQRATLDEYRALRTKMRQDLEADEAEKQQLRDSLAEVQGQLADGQNVRDNMREKLDRIHSDMAAAAEQLTNQKTVWLRNNEDLQKRCAVYQARIDSEVQIRSGLEAEVSRLREIASNGEAALSRLEQTQKTNMLLEETVLQLRDEVNEHQTSNSRTRRELQDARENSRIEIQRAQLLMDAGVETAKNQADASRVGLESKLSITQNELENMRALMDAMKARHDVLLQEEADLRRDTLLRVNEASSSALENLRARHEEDIHFVKSQHERTLADAQKDKARAEAFWNERLTMSDARHEHLKERLAHMEERLNIAKSAAQAAATAAQAARSTSTPVQEPRGISPQALRESILVLQEQLQERESRLERVQARLTEAEQQHPLKLKEKDIEISWLRELLTVRGDDLAELINTLSQPDFDREAARDAAIRIQTALQMEQAEKERHINAGNSLTGQVLAGVTNFASPKAVQFAAAFGNWRARGAPSAPTPSSLRAQRMASSQGTPASNRTAPSSASQQRQHREPDSATPIKRSSSPASWMSGLMTPPASNLRRTPSPSTPSYGTVSGPAAAAAAGGPTPAAGAFGDPGRVKSPLTGDSPATPGDTPLSFRRQSFDADAGEVQGVEALLDAEPTTLAQELEPLG